MKTVCKGKTMRVAFLAFLDFIFNKADDVTFYVCPDSEHTGIFVAHSSGCKNRLFINISYQTARIVYLVSVGQHKNYSFVDISYEEYCEILNSLRK